MFHMVQQQKLPLCFCRSIKKVARRYKIATPVVVEFETGLKN